MPSKVVKFATDISARVRAQQEARDTEGRLRVILDNLLIGIIMIDAQGQIVSLNPAAARMFACTPHEVIGASVLTLVPDPGQGTAASYLVPDQATDKSAMRGTVRELEGRTKDGRTFPLELTITEAFYYQERVFIGLVQEITERKQAAAAIRKSEQLLEETGRIAGVGGWEIDLPTSRVTWLSETYRILGAEPSYTPTLEEALRLYTPESRALIDAAITSASQTGEGWDLELSMFRCDGTHIWVSGWSEQLSR